MYPDSRKRDAPVSDTSSGGKVSKLDQTPPPLMSRVTEIYDDQTGPPGPAHGPSDEKLVPSHVIGTSNDPDLDIYERRRREVLSDPLLDPLPPAGDRFRPPHHPRDPLPLPRGKHFALFQVLFSPEIFFIESIMLL